MVVPVSPAGPAGPVRPASPANRALEPGAAAADDGLLKVSGDLHVSGVPLGAGKSIRQPNVAMGAAVGADLGPPLVRSLDGKITDVQLGGGGRYLVLTFIESCASSPCLT